MKKIRTNVLVRKTFFLCFSTVFLLIVLSVFLLPLLSDRVVFFENNFVVNNIVEGIVRLIFFILYVYLIGLSKDIKRVFAYHGAEHKTIAAYEHNKKLNSK